MTTIRYKELKINRIHSSSGLFLGTNIQNGRVSRIEVNEGFGAIKGKNSQAANNHTLFSNNKKGSDSNEYGKNH
ncbi:hypothetical protein DRW41_15810 [Neobacillus piezotolerans]|uniref:Uncharacterized protein n=1 Tax=Neobacillus piezotolerans TaxID=2259171 RepID=A0A3D8GP39_9BACI|nr:hypothetical protein [Neobacillus piezotolerans]RDU36052.1 hypothetical protein DRW41_15810 [Neobacillus piezotolerans]